MATKLTIQTHPTVFITHDEREYWIWRTRGSYSERLSSDGKWYRVIEGNSYPPTVQIVSPQAREGRGTGGKAMATRINGPSDDEMMGLRAWRVEEARRAACYPDLLAALKEIAKGEGAYNRDPLIHCGKVVDSMKAIALAAIAKASPQVR